jgi:hypothetical protein
VFSWCFGGFFALTAWSMSDRPMRMDYNLFLRLAHGLIPRARKRRGATAGFTAPALARDHLFAFARFLAKHWLVADYRVRADGLHLRLPPANQRWARVCSRGSGATAPMSCCPRRAMSALILAPPISIALTQLTGSVSVRENGRKRVSPPRSKRLGRLFVSNDQQRQCVSLGEEADERIFRQSPRKVARWRSGPLLLAAPC